MKKVFIIFTLFFALIIMNTTLAIADSADSESKSTASIEQHNEAADMNDGRGFAIPGDVLFPGTPGYYGEATPGHRFFPLNKLLAFITVWDVKAAQQMLDGNTGRKDVLIRDLVATKDTKAKDRVYCTIAKPAALGAKVEKQISIGTVAAKNGKSISADVLATAIVNAGARGSNYIMFMAEGVNREVDASGFGVGFNTTQASLQGESNRGSNVSSGGLGYSRGWAGYIDYPWLQFTYLEVSGLEALKVADAPETPKTNEVTAVESAETVEFPGAGGYTIDAEGNVHAPIKG